MYPVKTISQKVILFTILICIVTISIIGQSQNTSKNYTTFSTQDSKLSESISRGSEIYSEFCMQCHLPDGKGTPNVFPPLAGSDWLTNKRKESIHSIKFGLNGLIKVNGKTYDGTMTSLGLENEEIADVMNYIMNSWGNTQKEIVTPEEVFSVNK